MKIVALQSRRDAASRCRTTPASSSTSHDRTSRVTEPPTDARSCRVLRELDPERLYTA